MKVPLYWQILTFYEAHMGENVNTFSVGQCLPLAKSASVLWLLTFHDPPYDDNSYLYILLKVLYPLTNIMTPNNFGSHLFESGVTLKDQRDSGQYYYKCSDTCTDTCMTTGTYLDQLSNPKNPYFDTFDKSVALMVQKLVCPIFYMWHVY